MRVSFVTTSMTHGRKVKKKEKVEMIGMQTNMQVFSRFSNLLIPFSRFKILKVWIQERSFGEANSNYNIVKYSPEV